MPEVSHGFRRLLLARQQPDNTHLVALPVAWCTRERVKQQVEGAASIAIRAVAADELQVAAEWHVGFLFLVGYLAWRELCYGDATVDRDAIDCLNIVWGKHLWVPLCGIPQRWEHGCIEDGALPIVGM